MTVVYDDLNEYLYFDKDNQISDKTKIDILTILNMKHEKFQFTLDCMKEKPSLQQALDLLKNLFSKNSNPAADYRRLIRILIKNYGKENTLNALEQHKKN